MAETNFYKAILSKAMSHCARRELCIYDIRKKINSWGATTSDEDRIVETLVRENFINEERYAAAFVRDKIRYNKWGKVKITHHLKSKSIPDEIIMQSINSIDNDLYINTIKDLISGHRRIIKAKNQYDLKAKLLRYGLSKGFESNLLYDLLNEMEKS